MTPGDSIFQHLKDTPSTVSTPGITVLCPSRWTVRAESIHSILDKDLDKQESDQANSVSLLVDTMRVMGNPTEAFLDGTSGAMIDILDYLFYLLHHHHHHHYHPHRHYIHTTSETHPLPFP